MATLTARIDEFDAIYATNPNVSLVERIAYCILWGATLQDVEDWQGYEDIDTILLRDIYEEAYHRIGHGDFV